jgi:hypothetical protein
MPPVSSLPDRKGATPQTDAADRLVAVTTLIRDLWNAKRRPKKWLFGEAKNKFPDLRVREFNAAYKKALNRPRGRPPASYR